MANFRIPQAVGEVSVVRTRDAVVTITLNPDGKTFEILIDGALFKATASYEFMTSFVEEMLQDDLNMTSTDSSNETHGSGFEP